MTDSQGEPMATELTAENTAVCSDDALSVPESSRLAALEVVIEHGMQTFVEVGIALAEINASRLYRKDYPSFAVYCEQRWGMSRQRAYQLMEASDVATRLTTEVDTAPTNERQTRTLAALPKEKQAEAWQDAKDRAKADGLTAPTAKHVTEAVRAREPQRPEPASDPNTPAEPDDTEPDMAAELERANREIEVLQAQVDALATDDTAKELQAQMEKYAQLSARLQQEVASKNEAVQQAKWAMQILRRLCTIVGVEKPQALVGAVTALKG